MLCVRAERTVARMLQSSCNLPLGVYAEITGKRMRMRGYVGSPDGSRTARASVEGAAAQPEALGAALAAGTARQAVATGIRAIGM